MSVELESMSLFNNINCNSTTTSTTESPCSALEAPPGLGSNTGNAPITHITPNIQQHTTIPIMAHHAPMRSPMASSAPVSAMMGASARSILNSTPTLNVSSSLGAADPNRMLSPGLDPGNAKCPLCLDPYSDPKVLACFHTFCKPCLDRLLDSPGKIICPQCNAETQLCSDVGVESLLSDYGLANMQFVQQKADSGIADSGSIDAGSRGSSSASPGLTGDISASSGNSCSPSLGTSSNGHTPSCTGCKSKESGAVAHCQDCSNFLCANCVMAHQYMHCFEGHRVRNLQDFDSRALGLLVAAGQDRAVTCLQHRHENLKYFCFSCNVPICRECTNAEHQRGVHNFEPIADVCEKQMEIMTTLLDEARNKQRALVNSFKMVDAATQRLQSSYTRAQQDVHETAAQFNQMIHDQKQQVLMELETLYSSKQVHVGIADRKVQQVTEKLTQTVEFTQRLMTFASPTEVLVFKKLLETRLHVILNFQVDCASLSNELDIEFVSGINNARQGLQQAFGYVTSPNAQQAAGDSPVGKLTNFPPTPIGRPASRHVPSLTSPDMPLSAVFPNNMHANSDSNLLLPKHPFGGSSQSLGPFSTFTEPHNPTSNTPFPYEKWSSGAGPDPFGMQPTLLQSAAGDASSILSQQTAFAFSPDTQADMSDMNNRLASMFPPRSQIKRQKMIYHCKFGEFGVMEGQFTEPSGVAVNAQNDIIVADTNNHRIQVFDKDGRFKFQFGECGKRDGQLLYPNRVAVNRATGDMVVTERSPTHQIQVFNQYGQFLRKFGANILQHPRGVTVDCKGRIVVIECKVMRVLVFDMHGNVLQKFSCSRYLEFPNGVCTNDKQEIFISDNRAHCVKVFNYEGQFLRQLGSEGITNYPIGVGINQLGEVVVADNHNNFNLTVFNQDGTMVNALESKVKHAQCFDVSLLDDGSVVLASKDYRLYLYRYMQLPQYPA